jgi:hypothetical protein
MHTNVFALISERKWLDTTRPLCYIGFGGISMVEMLERKVGVISRDEIIGDDVSCHIENDTYNLFIRKELEAALVEAADPTTKWLSEEEFWAGIA